MNIIAHTVLITVGVWGDCILVGYFPYYFIRFEYSRQKLTEKEMMLQTDNKMTHMVG